VPNPAEDARGPPPLVRPRDAAGGRFGRARSPAHRPARPAATWSAEETLARPTPRRHARGQRCTGGRSRPRPVEEGHQSEPRDGAGTSLGRRRLVCRNT